MNIGKEIKRSLMLMVWFLILTFPIMIIQVNTTTDTILWRWDRIALIAIGSFVGSFVWNYFQRSPEEKKQGQSTDSGSAAAEDRGTWLDRILARFSLSRDTFRQRRVLVPIVLVLLAAVIAYPLLASLYQTNIMISALIYVILALGLNIVIGLGNMLHLGYAAFYLVGAYTYGLLNFYFGVSFWVALPIGAAVSALFGILLAIPVLRLRGDYLAIVTLAFGEIMRIVTTNWGGLTQGPSGVKSIPRPAFFGAEFSLSQATNYMYFICVALVILTIFVVNRLENSRIGRQLVAMGEDDIAARAMGVNTVRAKLIAFALGAVWAGIAGVLFAGKTTFINPDSFKVWESVLILSMVVLGGMGSIPGVIIGALALILLPEYLRAFSEYRLLIFGAILVIMMVFKPAGLIPKRRRAYRFKQEEGPPPDPDGTGGAGPETSRVGAGAESAGGVR